MNLKEKDLKSKIWLTLYNKERKFTWTKYFNNEEEKRKFKNRIRFVDNVMIIEDSSDIVYY